MKHSWIKYQEALSIISEFESERKIIQSERQKKRNSGQILLKNDADVLWIIWDRREYLSLEINAIKESKEEGWDDYINNLRTYILKWRMIYNGRLKKPNNFEKVEERGQNI